ncbi:MAG: small subunit ribosomal protein S17 [Candidatus Berkelbacteria bacterium Gr01-1014_85]|uniref:Small subunit ribosomal protein S17 n=1 Tax=Candidatus Berkelbacteria bacterium Gr01-1014_85 TaxID=2017150 RepID=A0A554JCX9_9BACT|nr:MAG: small subunit ribosomal protein S17 [Candidatus Berkelbacteria bacterium Gr01-1014_85]
MAKKQLTGKIVANKAQSTVTVLVENMKLHPLYGKRYRVSQKFLADTGNRAYELGTVVTIEETAPISKRKHFRVLATKLETQPEAKA